MAYRVDNVPWPIFPFFWIYSALVGLCLFFLTVFLHFTCRIQWENKDRIPNGSKIFCLWHCGWWPYFVARPFYYDKANSELWLNYAMAYMKPVHIMSRLMGIHSVMTLPGEEGRKAVEKVVQWLVQGGSTSISPDGPAGPPGTVKKGVLIMAKRSGAPIVPLSFQAKCGFPIPSWDEKRIPLPFSKIIVKVGNPIFVSQENFDESITLISDQMNQLEPSRLA